MEPQPSFVPLLAALVFAAPTAVLAGMCLPAAVLLALLGLLFAGWGRPRWRRAGLCALPALLAALPPSQLAEPALPDGPLAVRGRVVRVVRAPATGTTTVHLADASSRQRITFDADLEVLPGDELRALATAAALVGPELPQSLRGLAASVTVHAGPPSLPRLAHWLRRRLERQLLAQVPGEHGAMLATLVLGHDTRTPAALVRAHQDTGLSHLLAVSGAHAVMLAWLLGLAGRARGRLLRSGPRRATLMCALLVLYAFVTGGDPPVLRAAVTFVLATTATLLGRDCGLASGLVVPALLTCGLQPEALLGPSFLLSYAAVLGLALAARGDRAETAWWRRALRASVWATLLTAPLTAWFFGQVAPATVLLTPLLSPLVALLLLGGLISGALGCLAPALAPLLGPPLQLAAGLYADVVRLADHLPGTPVYVLTTPAPAALAIVALAAVTLLRLWPSRRCVAASAGLFLLAFFVPPLAPQPPRAVLFAVGHGQACLLETGNGHHTVVDCGSLTHAALAARLVEQALAVRRIDLLVVTHADVDHHAGVEALAQRVPIRRALLPQSLADSALAATLRRHGVPFTVLAPGQRQRPAPHLEVSAPWLPATATDNDQSLWVAARLDDVRLLLTGDAMELGVAAALADGIVTACDVLVLPHHGRANGNGLDLLQQARPRAVLASARTADGDTTLGVAARRFGAELWVTGQHGTLTVATGPPRVTGSVAGRPLTTDPGDR